MDGIVLNGKQDCYDRNKKNEWGRQPLEKHIKTKGSWYHRALGSLMYVLYDDCDVNGFLYRDGDISEVKMVCKGNKHHTVSHLVKR